MQNPVRFKQLSHLLFFSQGHHHRFDQRDCQKDTENSRQRDQTGRNTEKRLSGEAKMNDPYRYVKKRAAKNPQLAETIWEGYNEFKIGVILKEARLDAGLTQEQVAQKIHTTKSVISRIENHSEDIRLSTIEKFARALGKNLKVSIF
jgi:ribosome-binding protein aMBF1 (putative translation factor)